MQKHKFKFIRGDDVSYRLFFRKPDGSPVDLDGAKLDLHLVLDYQNEPVVKLSTETGEIELDDGVAVVHFQHKHTAQAQWGSANYDLQLTDRNGKRKTVLYGTVQIIPDQTRI